ncbi:penicillin-binding protein activator LpoB [Gilliamella apicola]|uniref:penicillin-binding protein activator LpoB n=1 Tax=Gilliamella apicola TaxID=1196095 RepID=UPI002FEDF4D7
MKQIKRIVVTSAIAFVLTGCHLLDNKDDIMTPPVIINPTDGDVIETPPLITKKTDWNTILSPFTNKLINDSSSLNDENKVLLISDIQNRSGDYLINNQIDETLHQLMNKQNKFTIASRQSINQTKQALGISPDDKLVSRGKMIGLAKSMNAGYVLFTTIYKIPTENNEANLSMELISTQTGEILNRVTSKDFSKQSTNDNQQSEASE